MRKFQKEFFLSPSKYIFFCSPVNSLLLPGTWRPFSWSLSFHLSFSSCTYSTVIKCWNMLLRTQRLLLFFYSSCLKNNFLCHLFGLFFSGAVVPDWPGWASLCGVPLQLINVFKKKPFFSPFDRNHLKAWQRQRTNSVKHSKHIPCHHPYDACKGWRSWSVCAEQLCRIL